MHSGWMMPGLGARGHRDGHREDMDPNRSSAPIRDV